VGKKALELNGLFGMTLALFERHETTSLKTVNFNIEVASCIVGKLYGMS
jgi:hypothetical protein